MTDKSDVDDIFALIAERDRLKASNAMLVKALEDIARECSAKVHVNLRLDPWRPRPECEFTRITHVARAAIAVIKED